MILLVIKRPTNELLVFLLIFTAKESITNYVSHENKTKTSLTIRSCAYHRRTLYQYFHRLVMWTFFKARIFRRVSINCEKHSRTPSHWLSNAFWSLARLVILSFSCFVKAFWAAFSQFDFENLWCGDWKTKKN